MHADLGSLVKYQMHSAVTFALILNFSDADRANLCGIVDMCPATGLIVDVGHTHHANGAGTSRWLHRHGSNQARVGIQLRIGHRLKVDGGARCYQLVQLNVEFFFVEDILTHIKI